MPETQGSYRSSAVNAEGGELDSDLGLEDDQATQEQSEALVVDIKDRKLVTQPYDLGLKSISGDITSGRIKLAIVYQRKYVWDLPKASRLIESILLNVPIPVCYFAEDEEGVYEVIDGLQRLQTIKNYFDNGFALTGIPVMTELEGKKFQDLDPRDQRRLENRTIRCIVITADSHPDIKFDVFERLNTGAVALTAQELRNSVYRGPLNDKLKEIASQDYLIAIVGAFSNKRMEIEEIILRYFALVEDKLENYQPPLRQFLNSYMRRHRKTIPSDDQITLFKDTCLLVREILGSTPFKTPGSTNPVNRAFFDSIMVPFALANQVQIREHANEVRALIEQLTNNEQFLSSIGRATANKGRMLFRVGYVARKLNAIGVTVDLSQHILLSDIDSASEDQ